MMDSSYRKEKASGARMVLLGCGIYGIQSATGKVEPIGELFELYAIKSALQDHVADLIEMITDAEAIAAANAENDHE